MIKEVITHPLFLTIVFAGIGTQLVKIIYFMFKYKRIHALDLVATGSMPSAHSALMTALTTTVFFLEGASNLFFITLSLTFIVIVDALGVRRTAGEEGKLLHKILVKTKLRIKEPHYSLGHTPLEVFVGIILGFVVSVLLNTII